MSKPSPLDAVHRRLGAVFTDFAGWNLPVRYQSDIAEHNAVRQAAGIFDISHMAEIFVTGPQAGVELDQALAGKFSDIPLGRAKYTLILNEQGGIEDDLIVYRLQEQEYMVVANAANRDKVLALLRQRITVSSIDDRTDSIALIAVQGPDSERIVRQVIPQIDPDLRYYTAQVIGDLIVGRTGYTGEDGFELFVPAAQAEATWEALMDAEPNLTPCGLGSRNSLRLEAGMPLYGNELTSQIKPAQAGLGRVLAGERSAAAEPAPDAPKLVALIGSGRRAAREGYKIYDGDQEVGYVTSGILSPTLQIPVAMGYVSPALTEPETELQIDVRGERIPYKVTRMPFYKRQK